MNTTPIVILIITLMGAFGAWFLTLGSWADATSTNAIGGLLVGLASVLGAAFGVSTRKQDVVEKINKQ